MRTIRQAVTALLATGLVFLCGCDLSTTAPSVNTFSSPATITGIVHGGQSPIYNANVRLYSAGTTGYGTGSTLLATTTSDVNGNFQFTKSPTNGPSSGTGPTWACPTTGNPQIYITAIGGNTQGTGVTATNNAASALMAAIGLCSGISSATEVGLNEISTVASVFALAQYINPGTTPGTETIGTSSSTQGATGINNAAATIANLANVTGPGAGGSVTSNTYTGSNASVNTVTITATPESAKLITIANILAACINTAAVPNSTCTTLFTAAAPPPTPATTSQPGATFSTAQDTIQAAYYMAVNPTDNTVNGANTAGATTNLGILYLLASSSPPFQTGLSAQPSDWTIGIAFTASGFCNTGTAGTLSMFNGPAKGAVDAAGNLWFVSGNTTGDTFGALSPTGKPIACLTYTSSGGIDGQGIAVDPTGNIWVAYNNAGGGSGSLVELNAANIATATAGFRWETPFSIMDVTSDGSGNLFLSGGGHSESNKLGGTLYMVASPGSTVYTNSSNTTFSATAAYSPIIVASGLSVSGSSIDIDYMAVDQSGTIWMVNATGATTENINNAVPATLTINGYSIANSNTVTLYTTTAPPASWASGTQNVVVQGLSTGLASGTAINHQGFAVSAISTTPPYSLTGTLVPSPPSITGTTPNTGNPALPTLVATSGTVTDAGIVTGFTGNTTSSSFTSSAFNGLAIDSSGYLYTGTNCCAAADDHAFVKVTPNATVASSQYSVSAAYLGGNTGIRGLTLDGAGNVWGGNILPATGTSASNTYAISEIATAGNGTTATFTALSPSGTAPASTPTGGAGFCNSGATSATVLADCPDGGGFIKSSFLAAYDLAIDPSGNLWVLNTGEDGWSGTAAAFLYTGASITEVVGAAVPVATPLAVAVANGTLATKP